MRFREETNIRSVEGWRIIWGMNEVWEGLRGFLRGNTTDQREREIRVMREFEKDWEGVRGLGNTNP